MKIVLFDKRLFKQTKKETHVDGARHLQFLVAENVDVRQRTLSDNPPRPHRLQSLLRLFFHPPRQSNLYSHWGKGDWQKVLLTEMYNTFEDEGWVVAYVNPHRNILEDLAAQIYGKGELKRLFQKAHSTSPFMVFPKCAQKRTRFPGPLSF